MSARALSILKNLSMLSMGRVLGDLVAFVLLIVISRTFGKDGTGHYSSGMALTSFIAILSDFGLIFFAVRELARSTTDIGRRFSLMQTTRIVLMVPVVVIFGILISTIDMPPEARRVAWVLAAYHVAWTFVGGLNSLFVSQEDMRTAGLAEFGTRAGAAGIGLVLLASGASLTTSLVGFPIAATVVGVVLHIVASRRWGAIRPRFPVGSTLTDVVNLIRRSASFGTMELLQHIATRIDVVFLGFLVGAAAAGVYNTAYRLVVFPQLLAYFASVSLLPHASRLGVNDPGALRRLYRDAVGSTLLLAMPAAVGLAILAPDLVTFVYSDTFAEAGGVLRVLSAIVCLSITKQVVAVFLMATDRQRTNFIVQAIAAGANVIGNLILIPLYGPMGAAWTSIGSEALAVVLLVGALRRPFGLPPVAGRLGAAALGSAGFVVASRLLPGLPWPAVIPLAIVVYATILWCIPSIRQTEGAVVRGWISR